MMDAGYLILDSEIAITFLILNILNPASIIWYLASTVETDNKCSSRN
jgi:hypothetical protein